VQEHDRVGLVNVVHINMLLKVCVRLCSLQAVSDPEVENRATSGQCEQVMKPGYVQCKTKG
jgi:hypothetical protein